AAASTPRRSQTLRNAKGQARPSLRSQSRASTNSRRRGPAGSLRDTERRASSRIAATSPSSDRRRGALVTAYWQGSSVAGSVPDATVHARENGFLVAAWDSCTTRASVHYDERCSRRVDP